MPLLDPKEISVVIPAYNSSASIARAINSVINQSVSVGEVVVVDDGSSDNTREVALGISPLVRVIAQANSGPAAARNRGVSEAKGSWIAFLDDDDYWHERKMELQLRDLSSSDRCGLMAQNWTRGDDFDFDYTFTQIPYVRQLILNRFQASTVLMKRSIFEDVGGFVPEFDGVEDWHLWLKATEKTEVILSSRVLVHYHDSAGGVSKKLWDYYVNMNKMLDVEEQRTPIDRKLFATIRAWHYQRMVVAFALEKMPKEASLAALSAIRESSPKENIAAFSSHLVPFLRERKKKRSKKR